ncbi:ABC transporter ATP-binding protein [Paenibacillus segetis]|uniref:Bacitracin ABC transporter ATP-binding protein n=1 Tax=Paenibacillus segetis TaxID=1325360 RepID=A0ABQ1YF33_9BACL|nr:ABC transporter ATP-binding protein [Paenibacillus segetis]GGH23780.1 bacitracin ABC transporter ATP-binding protein [Paenibacillus segetis]
MKYILRSYGLTKKYGTRLIVEDVNLAVEPGDIYGFLGQNGAGKTTVFRMLLGLVKPLRGTIEWFDEKPTTATFSRIGSLIETPGFYPNLTVHEHLDIHRRMCGVTDIHTINEHLKLVGMEGMGNQKVGKLSLGTKQRLGIARALLHRPDCLILDEPVNGLDPKGIRDIRELLLELRNKRSMTILISSHILGEIGQMVNRIGIIHGGKMIEQLDYAELQRRTRTYAEIRVNDDGRATWLLEQQLHIRDYTVWEKGCIRIYEQLEDTGMINKALQEGGVIVNEISLCSESLEDHFLKLTGGDQKC